MDRRPETHGTRLQYQRGCRCVQCRRSEAVYRCHLRQRTAKGKLLLGRRIPAGQTWRRLRQMVPEFGSQAAVARCLGLKKAELRLDTQQVTVRTALRVWRLYRLTMVENLDAPQ